MFLLLNTVYEEGKLPTLCTKTICDSYESAKDKMESQVDEALYSIYFPGNESDEACMSHVKEKDNNIYITVGKTIDWWTIVKI